LKEKTAVKEEAFNVTPVGYVRGTKGKPRLEILKQYRPALKQLSNFSHVIVLWWAHGRDTKKYRSVMQTNPPYAKDVSTGIFATRAPYRPNPIGLTTCRITGVDQAKGIVRIAGIDAKEGTPILDLKAYFPCCDRVKEVRTPDWLPNWPEWMHE